MILIDELLISFYCMYFSMEYGTEYVTIKYNKKPVLTIVIDLYVYNYRMMVDDDC